MIQRENFSPGDMEKWLDEKRITEVECMVSDMTGVSRGKILPRAKFGQDKGLRLPQAVMMQTVTGNYPNSPEVDAIMTDYDPDMVLRPDPETVCVVPWTVDPTAQVIHDCYFFDDQPVDFAPRSVLRRVMGLYREQGWEPILAPELEFYLTARNIDPDIQLQPPIGRSGRAETSRQAYSIDAVNEFDPLFEDIYDYCEAQGLDVDTLIHEVGAGQMEINFLHGDPMSLADRVFYFKRTVREAAMRHDMYATFMAKPMANEPGSAMHIHQSIIDAKTKQNIFSNPDGSASQIFYHFIGGLQQYLPAATIFFAPYVNSYRRIVKHGAAPINIQWGRDNRTVGIRVPDSEPSARRVENRVVGVDANPYVAFAATMACGYLGMMNKIEPLPEYKGSAYQSDFQLPRGLHEALTEMREAPALHKILGERFVKLYAAVKEEEYAEFMKVISPWEREHLLLHV